MNMDRLAELGPGGGSGWLVTSPLGLATGSCGSAERMGGGWSALTGYCGRAIGREVGV